MNRYPLLNTLLVLACLLIWTDTSAQSECVAINSSVNLVSLFNGTSCAGATNLAIENSTATGVANCTGCANSINVGTDVGTFDVIANPGPDECSVTVMVLDGGFTVSSSGAPACNEAELQVVQAFPGATYNWLIQPGNIQLNGTSVNYTFSNAQPDITLTVSSPACDNDIETTQTNITGLGPFAELGFTGVFGGFPNALDIADDGDFCTVSYCTDNTASDNQFSFSDLSYAEQSITNYTVSYNGTTIYNQASPPSGVNVDLVDPDDLGYNILVYTITDSNGCLSSKEYRIYWEALVLPQFSITSVLPDITQAYCSGDELEVTFEAGSQNPNDVTYSWAIGCNALSAEEINPLTGFNTLNLQAGQTTTVSIPLNTTSCGCIGDDLAIFALVGNPCNELSIDAIEIVQVSLDFTPSFDLDSPICLGDPVELNWNSGGQETSNVPYCNPQFLWSAQDLTGGGSPVDISNEIDATFTPTDAGSWEFCLEINSSCAPSGNEICEQVCVVAPITAPVVLLDWGNDDPICAPYVYEPTVSYTPLACESVTYNWTVTPNTGVIISNGNTPNPTIDFSSKGEYDITVTIGNGCSPAFTATAPLTVAEGPQLTANGPSTIACPDSPLLLDTLFCVDLCLADLVSAQIDIYPGTETCGTGLSPEWTSGPLVTLPGEFTSATCFVTDAVNALVWDIPSTADGDYTIILTVENACATECIILPLTVLSPSSITVPVPAEVCSGYLVDPSASIYNNCTWQIGTLEYPADGNSFPVTGPTDITITCVQSGCLAESTSSITVFPAIGASITPPMNICAGQTSTLTATPSSGVNSFQWFNGNCLALGTAIAGATAPNYTASSAGDYAVEITSSNGCVECADILLLADLSPGFNCALGPYCETETAQIIDLSCLTPPLGGWASIFPSWTISEGGTDIPASINAPADPASLNFTVADLLAAAGAPGVFTFTYSWTSPSTCIYSASFDITVQNLDAISIPLPLDTCAGTVIDPASFPALASCDWTIDGSLLTVGETFTINGSTTVEVSCGSGACVNSDNTSIDTFPPIAPAIAAGEPFICQGDNLTLTASGNDAASYQWYDGTCALLGTALSGETASTYDALLAGDYAVAVTSSNGCSECADIQILADPSPGFSCLDLVYCENESSEEIPFSCLTAPSNGWQGDLPLITVLDPFGVPMAIPIFSAPVDPALISFTVQDLIDAYGAIDSDSDFTFTYTWTSDPGCTYEDEFLLTLTAITFDFPFTAPICQGEVQEFLGGNDGTWYIDELLLNGIDPTDILIDGDGNLILTTGYDTPVQSFDSLVYTDGCSAIEYNDIFIMETPEVSIMNDPEMCIHDALALTLDPGTSQSTTLTYTNEDGVFSVPISTPPVLDPDQIGISSTLLGDLTYVGLIESTILGTTYTCSDTASTALDIFEIPQSSVLPDFCEGIAFDPALCSDPLVDSFQLELNGAFYTACPLNFDGVSGTQDYDLILYYGQGCSDSTSGEFTIQEALAYDFSYTVDECIPEVALSIELTGGQIEAVTFDPAGVFIEDQLIQTIQLPVAAPLQDQVYVYEVTIDDGGCTTETETIEAEYIAPLESIVNIAPGTSLCSPALIPFDLTQIGSNTLDSLVFVPGDGSPGVTYINDYLDIEHLYISNLDTTLFVAEFYLFNPCDIDTLSIEILIEPPVFSASIDEFISVCQGDTVDLSPFSIGSYISSSVIPTPGLSLNLFDINEPFLFIVPESQVADTFLVTIILTPDCGAPVELTTQVIVNPLPQPTIDYALNCFESLSTFLVVDPQTDVVYTWELPDGTTALGSMLETDFDVPGNQTIVLNSLSINGCSNSLVETIDVPGFYPISLSDTSFCGSASLDLSVAILPGESAEWNITGVNFNYGVFYPSAAINHYFAASTSQDSILTYMIVVERNEGLCSASDTLFVEVLPVPQAQLLISTEAFGPMVDPGEIAQLELCPDDFLYYSSASDSFNCFYTLTGTIEDCGSPDNCGGRGTVCIPFPFESGGIALDVTNEFGCAAEDEFAFGAICFKPIDIYVPNAFTPDGDLLNEFFMPIIAPYDNVVTSYDLRIYNRYGCEIWKTADQSKGWNGNSTQTCYSPSLNPSQNKSNYYSEDEVYTWLLKVRYRSPDSDEFTPVQMSGSVTLIR